jgi:hypothetical protein
MSLKNSNETIGNRTRDLVAYSLVPQPTKSQRTRINICVMDVNEKTVRRYVSNFFYP